MTGMFQSFISPKTKTFKTMTLRNLTLKIAPCNANLYLVDITLLRQRTLLFVVRLVPVLHGLCTNKRFLCLYFQIEQKLFFL